VTTVALWRPDRRTFESGREAGTRIWVIRDRKLVNLLADERRSLQRTGDRTAD
jgi:hypothetical protein